MFTREFGRGAQISGSSSSHLLSIFLLLLLHDAVDSKSNPVSPVGFPFFKFPRWGYQLINYGFQRVELGKNKIDRVVVVVQGSGTSLLMN